MRYSKIRKMDISNGEGIGVALFVQGCHFHCEGCFNQETWSFDGGKLWTTETESLFINLANKPYIDRISLLGGEPLCDENVKDVLSLIINIKEIHPEKKIWLYTGYNFDEIINKKTSDNLLDMFRKACVLFSTVVVDGKFQLENQDLYNEHIVWAGSTNQRVIYVKEYLENRKSENIKYI